jgi:hypothetical protein
MAHRLRVPYLENSKPITAPSPAEPDKAIHHDDRLIPFYSIHLRIWDLGGRPPSFPILAIGPGGVCAWSPPADGDWSRGL